MPILNKWTCVYSDPQVQQLAFWFHLEGEEHIWNLLMLYTAAAQDRLLKLKISYVELTRSVEQVEDGVTKKIIQKALFKAAKSWKRRINPEQ